MEFDEASKATFITLWRGSLIPLYTVLAALTWILHDYLVTLEEEVIYVWRQKWGLSKVIFLWTRYYSILLLLFDAVQIHSFTRDEVTTDRVCLAMHNVIRVVGAVSLWTVEIIMQIRVYALYDRSIKVALFNGVLFVASIVGFCVVLAYNAARREEVIKDVINLPLPGCPAVHAGIEWLLWVPATCFEAVLFGFVLWQTFNPALRKLMNVPGVSLYAVLVRDNIFYFFLITFILLFNNLMVAGVTRIPWFSFGPFHAAVGIATTRLLLHLRKVTAAHQDPLMSIAPIGGWDQAKSNPVANDLEGQRQGNLNFEGPVIVELPVGRSSLELPPESRRGSESGAHGLEPQRRGGFEVPIMLEAPLGHTDWGFDPESRRGSESMGHELSIEHDERRILP